MSPLTVRAGIEKIAPYVGGDSALPGRQRSIRLASNEGALGPSPMAVAAFGKMASEIHRYPDGTSAELCAALAGMHGLDAARIVCGAGSDELIALLCRAYAGAGDEILHTEHAFLMYSIAARTAGATPVVAPERDLTADVDALLERVTGQTRIVFLANPNNPTGTYLPTSDLYRLRAGLREDVLLVIDAAYAEYVERADYTPGAELVEASDNVVMTRTFSKLYALGGLRLGWAYCPTSVANVLNCVRNPFNVAAPAQIAGLATLLDTTFADAGRAHNATWLPWLTEQVRALGLEAPDSAGNFLLVRFPNAPDHDADAANAFLRNRGIIVRGMRAYGLPDALRITVGREDEMRAVAEALDAFID